MNNKKIATAILAGIFVILFALVGVGSCGGIKYLIDERSNVATVYADDIGSGSEFTTTKFLTIPLSMISYYVDGYAVQESSGNIEYNSGEYYMYSDIVIETTSSNNVVTSLVLLSYQYDKDIASLREVRTDLLNNNLIPLAFTSIYASSIMPGMLYFDLSKPFDLSMGDLLSATIDVVYGEQPQGYVELTLYFEKDFVTVQISPYRWNTFGDLYVNRDTGFSYKRSYTAYTGGFSNIDYNLYYDIGFQDAKDMYYDSRYQLGLADGKTIGYNQGILDTTDYSFVGLISAVIDVPVKAFTGLLDFNFLGFNIATFYKALLGFTVVIVILRIVI